MKLVLSSDFMKLKINFPKGLFLVGFTDTLGNRFCDSWFNIWYNWPCYFFCVGTDNRSFNLS